MHSLDWTLFELINGQWHTPWLDAAMPWIRNKWFWVPLYALVLGWLIRYKGWKNGLMILGGAFILVLLVDQTALHLFKQVFERLRPCRTPGLSVRDVGVTCGPGFSFISAHAANHMAVAIYFGSMVWPQKMWIRGLWITWAIFIGYAQIYVGVHFPLDVLVGFAVGFVWAYLLTKWMQRKIPELKP